MFVFVGTLELLPSNQSFDKQASGVVVSGGWGNGLDR